QGAGRGGHGMLRQEQQAQADKPAWPGAHHQSASATAVPDAVPAPPVDKSWFIPGDFDTAAFLANAKRQFIEIQSVWDAGDLDRLREYLTDDLMAEVKPEVVRRAG